MNRQMTWTVAAVLVAGLGAPGAMAQASAGAGTYASETAQAGQASSASAMQAANVSAELTKKIDSKDAKVGDEVMAKTTSEARLADGTKLPKGSKLVGHVTEVEARSKENHDGRVAFAFDHALLKDGREVPLNAMVRSLAAPAPMASASGSDDMMAGGGMQAPGGGGMERGGGGGGLVGAGAGTVRGATGPAAGSVGGTANGLAGNVTSGINGTADSTLGTAGRVAENGAGLNSGAGVNGELGAAMPVGNLSGVMFSTVNVAAGPGGASAAGGATMGTMLTGHNRNVTLDSGSQMTLGVAPR